MTYALRVHAFTLTDSDVASEHVYAGELGTALCERDVTFVDDWREADVVHLFEVNFYTGEAVRAFRYPDLLRIVRSDTPLVVSTDDFYFVDRPELTAHPRLYPLNHYTQRWLLRSADAVVAISESVRDVLARYVDPSKLHVVHHGVAERYYADPDEKEPFALHVSLASARKNPDAIRAFADRIDGRFVVAGGGWPDYFETVPENVDLPGYVPEDDLVDLYGRAAVFYFPTLHEGFGLPVLEAMAAGCAVVASDVFSMPEVVDDAGVLCDPHDVAAHVEHAERLLADDEERRGLGGQAQERAREFTWERAAAETEDVYRTVVPG